jgi:transposase
MARRIKIENHYTLDEWQKLIPKVQNLEHRFRMLIIENILKNPNISSKEICDKFYITTNTFFRWLKWYNEGGLEKLKNGEGGKGNKAGSVKYDEEIFEALANEIDNNQEQVWTLEKMQLFIKEKFNVEPSIQVISYRLKGKYSYKSSRPYPYKVDRDKLGRFKKKE